MAALIVPRLLRGHGTDFLGQTGMRPLPRHIERAHFPVQR